MTGQLCQGLRRTKTDADWHTHALLDALVKVLTPFLQLFVVCILQSVEIDKAFVDAISEISWSFLLDDFHDSACQFSIQLVVAGEYGYLLVWKLLGKLEVWGSGFDSHLLGFVAAGYNTAVVVAQHNNGLAVQVRAKDSFARDIAVITVNDAVHTTLIQNSKFKINKFKINKFKMDILNS